MKTIATITRNIENDKEITKKFDRHTDINSLIYSAKDYIKAIKEGRMICNIESVSSSGMSRNLKFISCQKTKSRFYYRNYWALFKTLGFTEVKQRDSFRIGGCGMDMVFHTNYTIIHKLFRLGFITKKECDNLCQQTPTVI